MLLQKACRAKSRILRDWPARGFLRQTLNLHGRLNSEPPVAEADLRRAIEGSWSRETSDDPTEWSRANPARGQCAVTALIVQDFLGGDLLCATINLTSHYWNLLPNRRELDLTKEQFKEIVMAGNPRISTRQRVLSFSETRRHYRRLRKLVHTALEKRIGQTATEPAHLGCSYLSD